MIKNMNYLPIVKKNLKSMKKMVLSPVYLKMHRRRFLTLIWQKFKLKYDSIDNKQLYIRRMMSRLRRHFSYKEEQSFLTDISNDQDMLKAVYRVVHNQWVTKQKVFEKRIALSIPLSAVRVVKGVGVGRGLEESGTMEYHCEKCNTVVGNTDTKYWKHMKQAHQQEKYIVKTNIINYF